MTDQELYAIVLGWLMPILIGLLQNRDWSSSGKELVALLLCLAVGVAEVYVTGGFAEGSRAVTPILLVFVSAKFSYEKFWHRSGVVKALSRWPNVD